MGRLGDVHGGDRELRAGRCTHTGSCDDATGRYEAAPQQQISEPVPPIRANAREVNKHINPEDSYCEKRKITREGSRYSYARSPFSPCTT